MAGVFDKMVVGINKGINAVSENSKVMIEKAQVNTAIQDAEKEKKRIYMELGELVYNLHVSGKINIEQCHGMCIEIKKLDSRIDGFQVQLNNLETQKNSLSGYENSITYPTYPSDECILCECGFNNEKTAKFCVKCGKQIGFQG